MFWLFFSKAELLIIQCRQNKSLKKFFTMQSLRKNKWRNGSFSATIKTWWFARPGNYDILVTGCFFKAISYMRFWHNVNPHDWDPHRITGTRTVNHWNAPRWSSSINCPWLVRFRNACDTIKPVSMRKILNYHILITNRVHTVFILYSNK